MGGDAPAAALVVAAAALPSSPHIGVRAARGIRSRALLAFAPCPPACPRWRRWRRGRGAKGCAPVAAGSLRPPCCRLRPSFAGSGGGWSLGGALAIKKGANVARVPSLPARRRARARVRLRGKQRWGACSPLWAAAPPPLLRPRPPLSVGGGGCGFHVSAAAGLRPLWRARKRPPLVGRSWRKRNIWCLPYLTAVFLLSHLVTQSAQEMSPVMFRQVRPMSNRRSTP